MIGISRRRFSRFLIATLTLFAVPIAGCDTGQSPGVCESNATAECACPDGGSGYRVCDRTGTNFSMCICDGVRPDDSGSIGDDAQAGKEVLAASQGDLDKATELLATIEQKVDSI